MEAPVARARLSVNDSSDDDGKVSSSSSSSNDSSDFSLIDKIKLAADTLQDKFHIQGIRATAPAKIFNPTYIRMGVKWKRDDDPTGIGLADGSDLALLWRSRDNRKGRSSIALPRSASTATNGVTLPTQQQLRPTSHVTEVLKNVQRMFTTFPYWDMAFWVGFGYTIGSTLWVINGFFAFLPIAYPETEFAGESTYGIGVTGFLGVLCYEFPAFIAYLESVNEGSFSGSAMRRFLEGREDEQKKMVDAKLRSFFDHLVPDFTKTRKDESAEALADAVDPEVGWEAKDRVERPGSIYPPDRSPAPRRGAVDAGAVPGEVVEYTTFRWLPTWDNFKSHHIHDIGFLACVIQLIGATIFICTGVVALPGIYGTLNHWQLNACYCIPQIVASACFLTASVFFTLETQEKWWKPEPKVLGWWIGVWSIIGSLGFEICGSLGPAYGNPIAVYNSSLASLWGSSAYLVSSVLQWYEAINKNPVEELFVEPGELKSWQVHPV